MRSAAPRRRLFFALWPDDDTRRAIVRASRTAVRRAGGRPVRPENLHMTLAFLGAVPEPAVPAVTGAARTVGFPGATLTLDRLGHFERARALWLGPSAPVAPLDAFVERLWRALSWLGFERDHPGFRPHVTLCRKTARAPALEIRPVVWTVRDWVLVQSDTLPEGPRYTPVARWPAVCVSGDSAG
jgi:2'-5' RNA ligase